MINNIYIKPGDIIKYNIGIGKYFNSQKLGYTYIGICLKIIHKGILAQSNQRYIGYKIKKIFSTNSNIDSSLSRITILYSYMDDIEKLS